MEEHAGGKNRRNDKPRRKKFHRTHPLHGKSQNRCKSSFTQFANRCFARPRGGKSTEACFLDARTLAFAKENPAADMGSQRDVRGSDPLTTEQKESKRKET